MRVGEPTWELAFFPGALAGRESFHERSLFSFEEQIETYVWVCTTVRFNWIFSLDIFRLRFMFKGIKQVLEGTRVRKAL